MSKPLLRSILIGLLLGVSLYGMLQPEIVSAETGKYCVWDKPAYKAVKTIKMVLTAYTSSPDETDDTPFITASGKMVRDGIIANNLLPFGTKIRIPDLYGDKVFTVEDRMNASKGNYHADIWMPLKNQAREFGVKLTDVEIVQS